MTDERVYRKRKALEIIKRTQGDYAAAFSEVRQLPAADVAPMRHGKWNLAEDAVFRCSECGRICYELDAPYCYCGAKMDKEDWQMDRFMDYDSYITFMDDLYNRADGYHIGYETMGIPTEEFESKAKDIRDILIAIKEGLSQ